MGSELRVMGIDASLTNTGLCIVPEDWDLDYSRIVVDTCGYALPKTATETDRTRRLIDICRIVCDLADRHRPSHICIEGYAFNQRTSAHALAELGGALRVTLSQRRLGLITSATESQARKLIGKFPRKGAKVAAHLELYRMGAPKWWSGDVCDAFLQANWLMSELGGCAIAVVGT